MPTLAADHLRRLEQLLATAQSDYDTLAYIILEGPTQVTFHSLRRSITVPVAGDDVGHLNGMLAEATLARVRALEKEMLEAHAQVVAEADDLQVEADRLALFRDQARAENPASGALLPAEHEPATPPLS